MPGLPNLSGADLLNLMTGEAAPARARSLAPSTWDQMLRELVAKYGTANPDPRQSQWVARMDDAITGEMRALLHHPESQALESVWRGMYFLARRLDTGEDLKIYLMDLPQEEVTAGKGLADVSRALEGESMAVMVGLYSFGKTDEPSLELLSALAQNANVPILSGLAPSVVGIEEVFEDLRASLKARAGSVSPCIAFSCVCLTAQLLTKWRLSDSKRCRRPHSMSGTFGAIRRLPAPTSWEKLSAATGGRCAPGSSRISRACRRMFIKWMAPAN